MESQVMPDEKIKQCGTCGACIGPGYMEKVSYPVGKYEICGWCRAGLKKHGFVQVSQLENLLPDGRTVKRGRDDPFSAL